MNTPTTRAAMIALAFALSGSVLVPATPAQAAVTPPDPITSVTVSGLKSIMVPYSNDPQDSPFTVQFVGAAADPDDTAPADGYTVGYDGYGEDGYPPEVTKLASKDNVVVLPEVSDMPDMEAMLPGTPLVYRMRTYFDTSPGKYRVSVPVTQSIKFGTDAATAGTLVTTSDFTVTANPKVSAELTDISLSGKLSKKSAWKGKINGPNYQDGATLTIYFKAKGGKTVKIYSSKLNSSGDKAITLGKGKIRKTGTLTFKVGAVTYSPAFSVSGTVR